MSKVHRVPVKFDDGVVHLIDDQETKERWGRTFCDRRFTVAKRFKDTVRRKWLNPAVRAKTHATCLLCIGSQK
jgi:hypothetical protein